MDWPQLRESLSEITAAYPDPWNANAERAMACLVGTEADFQAATARAPKPLFSVAWYDRYTNWPECAARQQAARAPIATGVRNFFLGASLSAALFVTATGAVLLCLLILIVMRHRAAAASEIQDAVAVPGRVYVPSPMWRAGQMVLGLILCLMGLAGVWGLGAVAEFRDTPPALVLVFLSAVSACGGGMLIANALRFHVVLCGNVLEVHQLSGVRFLRLQDLASRRTLTVQGTTFIELRFKDPKRRPYKLLWAFVVDQALGTFLQAIPDSDEQAAKALDEEIRADLRLGTTPEERSERFARTTGYLRYTLYCGPALLLWSALYPHPYWLLIAVLALLPWVCLLAMRLLPGMLQLGDGSQSRSLRPDVASIMIVPIVLLALRAFHDIHTLDWQVELRWIAAMALLFGVALYRVGAGQALKRSVMVFLGVLCLVFGYGSTVMADALLDRTEGEVYRTQLLAKHVTSGRYRNYSLTIGPWGNSAGIERVSVTRELYSQLNVGHAVCIDVHPGALGVPWYEVIQCQSP